MIETLEYRARQYAAELGDERLAELMLDLVDELDSLGNQLRESEEKYATLRKQRDNLANHLEGALSAYSLASSEADRANAEALSLQQAADDLDDLVALRQNNPFAVDAAHWPDPGRGALTLSSKGFTVRKCSECGSLIGEVRR